MKKVLILLLILTPTFLSAQSIVDLDVKNGFRNFKIGSHPSQIKNIEKSDPQKFKNPNVSEYDYIGEDIQYIFNVKVDKVTLIFFKNKLCNIGVSFGNQFKSIDFTLYEYNILLEALEKTYGTEWAAANNKEGVITNGAIWDGKNIRLELMRVDFSLSNSDPKNYGYISGYINVYDKKLSKEMISSNF